MRSLGAKFIELEINAEGQGGYARELTAEEKASEQQLVSAAVARADIVITTASIPGKKAPLLITKETVATMRPGAVIVDLAAESGGNSQDRDAPHLHGPPRAGAVPFEPDVCKEPPVVPGASR